MARNFELDDLIRRVETLKGRYLEIRRHL